MAKRRDETEAAPPKRARRPRPIPFYVVSPDGEAAILRTASRDEAHARSAAEAESLHVSARVVKLGARLGAALGRLADAEERCGRDFGALASGAFVELQGALVAAGLDDEPEDLDGGGEDEVEP